MATTRWCAAALLALSIAVPASAQQAAPATVQVPAHDILTARDFAPPAPPASLTLGDSVRLALLHAPGLAAGVQSVQGAIGRVQRTRGAFDSVFRVAPGVRFEQTQIRPEFREAEFQNRLGLRVIADDFTLLERAFRDLFNLPAGGSPPCPRAFLGLNTDSAFTTDFVDQAELSQIGIDRDIFFRINTTLGGLQNQINLADICSLDPYVREGDSLLARYLAKTNISGGEALAGILRSTDQLRREFFGFSAELSEAIAARARLGLERLGPIAEDQLRRTFTFEAAWSRTWRSGLGLSADLSLQTDEQAYRDRPLDPGFGGLGMPNSFPSRGSVTFNMPLGRGLGSSAATAQERAAAIAVGAETDRLRHAVSQTALSATLAHLNAVAAAQVAAMLAESAERQKQLASMVEQLVTVGDVARLDLDRAQARAVQVGSAAIRAQVDLINARAGLAETIGLDAAGAVWPATTDGFAEVPPAIDLSVDALAETALTRRLDLRGAERQAAASAALTAGASSDLRRKFDLSLTAGLSNRYESPFFRYFEDERFPIYSDFETPDPIKSPVRWYSGRGVYRSLTGRWEPFVSARFSVEFPLGNHAAEGRFAQAQATERQSRIRAGDLRRTIRASVQSAAEAVRKAATVVAQRRDAVARDTDALTGAMEQLRAGEITVIDVLTTEEALTNDKVALARAELVFHSTMARLRYETGDLVGWDGEGSAAERVTFATSLFTLPATR